MRNVAFMFIGAFLLLLGCNNDVTSEPIKKKKEFGDFNLALETPKEIYEVEDEIKFNFYFEYVGEKEIKLEPKPTISFVIKNEDRDEIIEEIPFTIIDATMKKGDSFTQDNSLRLEKGKYQAFLQVSMFSVDSSQYSIGTSLFFEVE